ncbi:MAG: type II/IV secretion system ATPase subunit [Candidatus Bathyarchaeota archaeon]|nr:type II/IV secretion system ATPase subunit [Candidatus Bathyarchaeota archaeon]
MSGNEDQQSMAFRDFYPVNPPFGFVGIEINDERKSLMYHTVEPTLTDDEDALLDRIKKMLIDRMNVPLDVLRDSQRMENYLRDDIQKLFKRFERDIPKESEDKFIYYLKRDFLGYGKIDLLVRDENIEDISCNGYNTPIYVWHRNYESIPTNIIYKSPEELDRTVIRLAYRSGRQVSISHPIMEGTLPEGFRVQITLEEVSKRGDTFTIRKFRENPFTIIDLIKYGTLSAEIAAYLWILVEHGRSVMICGATASGKTTLLNSLSMFIKPEMKVVTIEEVRELRLHENWIPMVPRPSYQPGVTEITLFDLLKSALRQRPDYIIVGEVRGEEAYTLFQAIATGHGGLCTIHSDSVEYAIKRLLSRPMDIPAMMVPLMNVLLQIRRVKIGEKVVRRADTVTEIIGLSATDQVQFEHRFRWDSIDDTYRFLESAGRGEPVFKQIANLRHVPEWELEDELKRRTKILEWMVEDNLNSYDQVSNIVHTYYVNPEEILTRARFDEVD